MKVAKDCLDIGLITERSEMIDFFADEVGLGAPEALRISKAMTQYRFDVAGSVVKVNVLQSFDSAERSGYRGIAIARSELNEPVSLTGPDGIQVELVPTGYRGIGQLGVRLEVPDLETARRYFEEALGWETLAEPAEPRGRMRVSLGRSVVLVSERADAPSEVHTPVSGWNYLTVQIHDCDGEIAQLVERGVAVAAEAKTLGDVARFGMVADPWGNQLEISERFSLVGRR